MKNSQHHPVLPCVMTQRGRLGTRIVGPTSQASLGPHLLVAWHGPPCPALRPQPYSHPGFRRRNFRLSVRPPTMQQVPKMEIFAHFEHSWCLWPASQGYSWRVGLSLQAPTRSGRNWSWRNQTRAGPGPILGVLDGTDIQSAPQPISTQLHAQFPQNFTFTLTSSFHI